jgi:YfiH family protein
VPEDRATPLEMPGGGRALFTTRTEGNLSTLSGRDAQHGLANREALRARWNWRELAHARQVHGAGVQRVDEETVAEADGHVVGQRGVAAMVLVADCLPIALAGERAVAIVHAGWRGLAAGVIENGVQTLREAGAGEGADDGVQERAGGGGGDQRIAAAIGPGAGVCCYEVGEEVHAAFAGAHRHGRNLDLRAIARERLRAAGVGDIQEVAQCTICCERLFSHRRQGSAAGRQAGVVWRA